MNKELKTAIKFINDISEKLDSIINNGSVNWVKLGFFLVGKIRPIVNIVKTAPIWLDQYENLTVEGRSDLIAWFAKDFDIANDIYELQIEKIFGQLIDLINPQLIRQFRSLIKTILELK